MRVVAEYVMRGRMQALWVAILGASTLMFSWLSAAVIGLVALRKGPAEAFYVLAWALLPAAYLVAAFGDIGPLVMLLGTAVLATVLRWVSSWPLVLLTAVMLGGLTGLGMLLFGTTYLEQLVAFFAKVFADLQGNFPEGQLQSPSAVMLAGMLGLMNAVSCVLCLLLARWWQASLYNPGGFREEFHGIRLPPQLGAALVLAMLAVNMFGLEYRPWAVLVAVPLSVAGLGFIHARAEHRKLGVGWLSVFYVLWLLLDPIKLVVIGVAVADSFFDFRGRWASQDQE